METRKTNLTGGWVEYNDEGLIKNEIYEVCMCTGGKHLVRFDGSNLIPINPKPKVRLVKSKIEKIRVYTGSIDN